MKIVVVGLGYVGTSNAVLLATKNEVIGVDIDRTRVNALQAGSSPIVDDQLSSYLASHDLDLSASTDLKTSIDGADYIIISTPTNYDPNTNYFDTSTLEEIISQIVKWESKACIVVKSTVPVGFTDAINKRLATEQVIFSPEFLREGQALTDNLHPSRIIIGEKSKRAEKFADLVAQCAIKRDVEILFTGSREAEAIKLFSNTYLALRVAFFNELDSYALTNSLDTRQIIDGVSLDPRIGKNYNNPSFGYGGYCLPKDTKQLLANYRGTPQNIIGAIVDANETRKEFLAQEIIRLKPNIAGIHLLSMKIGSDNYRQSAVLDIINIIKDAGINIIIYEPTLKTEEFLGHKVYNDLKKFKTKSSLIITNRMTNDLIDVKEKVFSRDVYQIDK